MILEEIIRHKRSELALLKSRQPLHVLEDTIRDMPPVRDFKQALRQSSSLRVPKRMNIIAEVKKASPSRGVIRSDFDPVEIAKTYQTNGAVALSVLTDEKYFQGAFEYLKQVKEATTIPVLDKDFIIDPYQIYQARRYGADAVLLIAAVLSDAEMGNLMDLAQRLGLSVLVEVHTHHELTRVLLTDAHIIGINNRDLTTFRVDTNTSLQLVKHIPDDKLVVSESGIDNKEIMQSLHKEGIDAFLIGEAFMKEKDIGKKLRELLN